MIINVTYDASVTSAPAGFKAAVDAAVAFYENTFDTNLTVNITIGWGEMDGTSMSADELGVSTPVFYRVPYAASPLIASGSPATEDLRLVLQETASSITADQSLLVLPSVQMRMTQWWALPGLYQSLTNWPDQDGYIGISSTAPINFDPDNRAVEGEYDGVGIIIHEISHVLGRVLFEGQGDVGTNYQPLDFFRYSAPGVHTFTPGAGYLSLNGDQLLYPFNDPSNGGTSSDWSDAVTGDTFDAFGTPGEQMAFSAVDYRVMQLLGFHISPYAATQDGMPVAPLVTNAAQQLAQGQSLSFDGMFTIVIDNGATSAPPPSFTNAGTIINTGAKSATDVVGVTTGYVVGGSLGDGQSSSVPSNWFFTNTATGTLSVTAMALAGDADGVWWGPAVDNAGTIQVTSNQADAWGIRGSSLSNETTGTLKVHAANDAWGVLTSASNGTYTFSNAGTIEVTAQNAIAVEGGFPEIDNSGSITATGTTSIALLIDSTDHWVNWSYLDYTVELKNSGLIEATDAIAVNPNGGSTLSPIDLTNSGTIRGNITLLDTASKIRNSGSMVGAIRFGMANSTYDGTGGTQSGGIYLGLGSNTVILGDDGEAVYGGTFSDSITGGKGNDFIEIARGTNTIDGGSGLDTLSLAEAAMGYTVDLGAGTAVGPQTTVIKNIEQVLGSTFNDTLKAGATGATLIGGAGHDILIGGAGDDTLIGGGGDETSGNGGHDTFIYDAGFDAAGGGQLVIDDFQASQDVLRIYEYGAAVSVVQQGADTLITLSSADSVLLKGVQSTALTASNVLYYSSAYAGTSMPASLPVYGTTTIRYNSDLTIAAGEALKSANLSVALLNLGDTNDDYCSLDNFGTVSTTTASGSVSGFGFAGVLGSNSGSIKNELGGSLSVTDTDAAGTAKGIDASRSPAFTNYGSFAVSAAGKAYGIYTSNDDLQTNAATGTFSATSTGDTAYGVWSQNGSNVTNAGTWTVTGASAAYGIRCERYTSNCTINNSGTLTATATSDASKSWGIWLEGDAGTQTLTIVNSGIITAATAIEAHTFNLVLHNSGTLNGDINTVDYNSGYTDITNTGTINGNIHFGNRECTFDGSGGALHGAIYLGSAVNTVKLGDDGETVTGGGLQDTITGGAGNDVINIARGMNVIDGGGGFNTLSLASSQVGCTVDLGAGTVAGAGYSTIKNIQCVIGSSFDDVLKAGSSAVTLIGGAGQDILIGGAGADTLVGHGGDQLTGNGGNDTFVYTPGAGQMVVTDFANGGDVLDVYGYAASVSTQQQGDDVLITLSSTDSVLLKNVQTSQLSGHVVYNAGTYTSPAAISAPVWTGPTGSTSLSYVFDVYAGETITIAAQNDVDNRNYGFKQISAGRQPRASLDTPFDNAGTININSADRDLIGFENLLYGFYNWEKESNFRNQAGAVFNVTSTCAETIDPWGGTNFVTGIFGSSTYAENVINAGLITVSGIVTTKGISLYQSYDKIVENSGTIRVTSSQGDAIGILASQASNDGTITVTAAHNATGICFQRYLAFTNTGTITATSTGSGGDQSVGVDYQAVVVAGDDVRDFRNSGTITAKTAVRNCPVITNTGTLNGDVVWISPYVDTWYMSTTFTLNNSGTLNGSVISSFGNSVITNTGTITGSVNLGDGNDFFDGRGGIVMGMISGGAGNDTFYGGAGNDTFCGGGGNDVIAGGAGYDTAVFSGNRSAYTITHNANGSTTVTGPDGTDTLTHIELAKFSDQTVAIGTVAANDFAGTGTSSILWQNDSGQAAIWTMNGLTQTGGSPVGGNPGPAWHVVGSGDFFGDGSADILWQNDDGAAVVWTMNGLSQTGSSYIGGNAGPTWHVKSTADFNDDGKADILWQNDSGQAAIWEMNGYTVLAGNLIGGNPGTSWHIVGAGDFNGDGKADIVWQSDSGQAVVWTMDGLNQTGSYYVGGNPGPTWHIKGVADFYGTGQADILWQNDNGQAVIWTMNGVNQTGSDFVGGNPGPTWHIVGTGDYNGDGCADILWQNDNGQAAIWTMNGVTQLGGNLVGGNPGTTWHIPSGVG